MISRLKDVLKVNDKQISHNEKIMFEKIDARVWNIYTSRFTGDKWKI